MPFYPSPGELPSQFNPELLGEYSDLFFQYGSDDDVDRRVLYWSLRLMIQTNGGYQYEKIIAGFKNTAYGFFKSKNRKNDFGVIVYAESYAYWINKFRNLLRLLGLKKKLAEYINVDGHRFRIVYRHIREQKHIAVNPSMGTSTCFAFHRKRKSYSGILTASHVVDHSYLKDVPLSCGKTGDVVAIGHCMEAAVISSDCMDSHILNSKQIYPRKLAPQHAIVQFEGINQKEVTTRIRQVTDTRGLYYSSITPIIIYLEHCGLPGDSGALIDLRRSGEPYAIYIGSYEVRETGETGGLAQHLYQVAAIMELELFK